jgi:hypothetical protein
MTALSVRAMTEPALALAGWKQEDKIKRRQNKVEMDNVNLQASEGSRLEP